MLDKIEGGLYGVAIRDAYGGHGLCKLKQNGEVTKLQSKMKHYNNMCVR